MADINYDVNKGLAKGGKALAGTGVSLTVSALIVKLAVEQGVGIPDSIRAELTGAIAVVLAFGFEMLRNWLKVRGILTTNF